MASWHRRVALLVVASIVGIAIGCGRGRQAAVSEPGAPAQAQSQPSNKTLVIGINVEPTTLAGRVPRTTGSTPFAPTDIFDAWLVTFDGKNVPRAQLAEKIPELNTADWEVFPDGTMETTFHIRSGLTWHDGMPLRAGDFVFGWQVWTWPDMGVTVDAPIRYMQEVTAPDDRTVVIRWKQLYPGAGPLDRGVNGALTPMPRHLLEARFRAGDGQAFLNDPWWTTGFIGSGPYRLDRWEPGAFIQGSGFASFVEGAPKISQIKLVFLGDPNAAVAALRSGEVHVVGEGAIGFEQGLLLKREWEAAGDGVVLLTPNKSRFIQVQFKRDYVNPRAILDPRVRRAVLEATDRAELSAGILAGQVALADTLTGPVEEYFEQLDRVLTKYPYNPQNAAALMGQAGYARGAGGLYADGSGQRLSVELRAFPVDPGPREAAILVDMWKTFGVDTTIHVIPAAQSQDLEQASAYPAFRIEQSGLSGTTSLGKLTRSLIATAENHWAGPNRGGWTNPDYERFWDTFSTSLDRGKRNEAAVQAWKIASDELPVLPLYYLSVASAFDSALRGPTAGYERDTTWTDVGKWEWIH